MPSESAERRSVRVEAGGPVQHPGCCTADSADLRLWSDCAGSERRLGGLTIRLQIAAKCEGPKAAVGLTGLGIVDRRAVIEPES